MTKLEILKETFDYYTADPTRRGIDKGRCVYDNGHGGKCAVGRCMNDKANFRDGGDYECYLSSNNVGVDDHLKPEYHGHGLNFWLALQRFHDDNSFWQGEITEAGLKHYNLLVNKYTSNINEP